MTRTLTSGMQTAIDAEVSTVVRLVELEYSGGTLRFSTASQELAWDSQTWEALGGAVRVQGTEETPELADGGVSVVLSGVDGALISTLFANSFRGHVVRVWRAHIDDGEIVADPIVEFVGYQNDPYRITDNSKASEGGNGKVEIKTRWVSRLARLAARNAVRTNLHSHREMLRRAGLTGTNLDDSMMRFVPAIQGKRIRWGSEAPQAFSTGKAGGSGTDKGEWDSEQR